MANRHWKKALMVLVLGAFVIMGFSSLALTQDKTNATGEFKLKVKSLPEMLAEAGFKVYPAETSQEMAYLKSFPTGTLMIHQQIGRVIYCFLEPASPTLSNTLYMGNYSAYRNFQDLLEKQKQEIKEKRIESDQEFWNTWGRRYFAY